MAAAWRWLVLVAFLGFLGFVGSCGIDDLVCGPGTQRRRVCTGCGPAGGCSSYADQCVQTCAQPTDCTSSDPLVSCFDGVCQVGGCL